MGKKYTDVRGFAEERFNPLDHQWVFSVAVSGLSSPQAKYEPIMKEAVYAYARQFAYSLDAGISELYKEEGVYSHVISGPVKDGVPVSVSTVIGPLEKVVAVSAVYIHPFDIHEKTPKGYIPVAFVDIGTDDLSQINRFLQHWYDQVVFLRRLEIEGQEIKHYALLIEPKSTTLVSSWRDEAAIKKVAFDITNCSIRD